MKYLNLVLFCFCFGVVASAQYGYTYISDRRFFGPENLIGYDFRPIKMEVPNKYEQDLEPGEYSFGISSNNLYVEGGDIRGVYNINNTQPAEYGYKMLLMNARDARLQGHLKVILNKWGMVDALIFKRSPKEEEIIFYQSPIPTKLNDQERDFFTDRHEAFFEAPDSLWGKSIYPFFRVHLESSVQEPLDMGDSTRITFIKKVTIEEKDKKEKKKKSKKEEVTETDITEETISEEVVTEISETMSPDSLPLMEDPDKKIKIITEYFVEIRSILQYEDGTREDKTWTYPIKRIAQREDEYAKMEEERHQWEFVTEKKDKIYLYLTGDNAVSSFEVGEKLYQMRGF